MKVLIATDFEITYDGHDYWFGSSLSSIIDRFFGAFGKLAICTRIDRCSRTDGLTCVSDRLSEVYPIGGLAETLTPAFRKKMSGVIGQYDLVICRLPSLVGYRAAGIASHRGIPVLAECMGCAWDAYWNHGIVGKAIAPYMFFRMKSVVRNADYALYVTEKFLQKRYPCRCPSIAASNVKIDAPDREVLERRLGKIGAYEGGEITLMTAAAVNVRHKGQEYVIKAIPSLNRAGIRVKYIMAGMGSCERLRAIAVKLGVSDQTVFPGKLSREDVLRTMDDTDIYIQPSLQEGLPRAMIEAMSRGCPCIGAATAGIPELIDSRYVVRRRSPDDIADTVIRMLKSDDMAGIAARNAGKSAEYASEILDRRRNEFFDRIKKDIDG